MQLVLTLELRDVVRMQVDISKHIWALYLPLIITNVLHMVLVKFDWLPALKIPLNKKLFGSNKTYRGFLFLSTANALVYSLLNHVPGNLADELLIGFFLGLTYMCFELPNSYFKRKLGIASGEKSPKYYLFFLILDKADSCFGVSLLYTLYYDLSPTFFLYLFVSATMVHFLISLLLVKVRIKESL